MPDLDGISATREILDTSPEVKVVILTTFEQDDYVFGALRAGASGFLLKRTKPEQLIAAIYTITAGDSLLAPSVTRRNLACASVLEYTLSSRHGSVRRSR